MARYYDLDKLSKLIEARADTMLEGKCAMLYVAKWLNLLPTADVVEVVRCNDCKHWRKKAFDPIVEHNIGECHCAHWENDYFSYETFDNDFCSYGTPKERGADNPKITCLNCKHLMYSDMYGECNKQLKIVNPSDTCEYAEPKERGAEK